MPPESTHNKGYEQRLSAIPLTSKGPNPPALKLVETVTHQLPAAKDVELLKEMINSIIHGMGILFGIAAIPLLTALAVRTNNIPLITGACIYGFTFLMVFSFSTGYHGFQQPRIKRILEILDHISIYFLIAGTYTPLVIAYFNNTSGKIILVVLWGLTLAGIFFKVCFGCRYNLLSTIVYLLMGWILVWTGGDFLRAMPSSVAGFILLGGALYTVGVVFFLWEKLTWHHAIWHSFALSGAICHYIAILMTVSGLQAIQ